MMAVDSGPLSWWNHRGKYSHSYSRLLLPTLRYQLRPLIPTSTAPATQSYIHYPQLGIEPGTLRFSVCRSPSWSDYLLYSCKISGQKDQLGAVGVVGAGR